MDGCTALLEPAAAEEIDFFAPLVPFHNHHPNSGTELPLESFGTWLRAHDQVRIDQRVRAHQQSREQQQQQQVRTKQKVPVQQQGQVEPRVPALRQVRVQWQQVRAKQDVPVRQQQGQVQPRVPAQQQQQVRAHPPQRLSGWVPLLNFKIFFLSFSQ